MVVLLLVLLISSRTAEACLSSGGLSGFGGLGSLGSPLSPSCGCPGCSCASYPSSPQISYSHNVQPMVIQSSYIPPPPPPPAAVPLAPYSSSSYGSSYAQPTLIGSESQASFQQQQQRYQTPLVYPAQPAVKQGSQALFQHTIITPASQYAPPTVYNTAPQTIAVAEPQMTQNVDDQTKEVAPETPVAPTPPEETPQTKTNVVVTESENASNTKVEDTEAVFPPAEKPTDITSQTTPVPTQPQQQIQVPSSKRTSESDAYLEVKKEPVEERRMNFVTYYNQECSGQIIDHSNAETIQSATIKCFQLGCQSANLKPNIKGNYQVDFLTNVDSRLNKGGSYCLSLNTVPLRKRSAKRSHAKLVSFKVSSANSNDELPKNLH